MRIVLSGPPGSGKATQGKHLADELGITYLVAGDLLRAAVAADTPVGRQAREAMAAGGAVSDALVVEAIAERVSRPDVRGGFVLDGFPRTIPQAEALQQRLAALEMPLDAVILLEVDPARLAARLDSRRVDDTTHQRLRVYAGQTLPLAEYFRRQGILRRVDGNGDIAEVRGALKALVDGLRGPSPEATPRKARRPRRPKAAAGATATPTEPPAAAAKKPSRKKRATEG